MGHELIVITNVVLGLVIMGGEDEKHAFITMVEFFSPNHWRHINAEMRLVEQELVLPCSVVNFHTAGAVEADQQLLAFAMRVLSPTGVMRHAIGGEVTARHKGEGSAKFPHTQISARGILNPLQLVKPDAAPRAPHIGFAISLTVDDFRAHNMFESSAIMGGRISWAITVRTSDCGFPASVM